MNDETKYRTNAQESDGMQEERKNNESGISDVTS